jgi:hypothetical protein
MVHGGWSPWVGTIVLGSVSRGQGGWSAKGLGNGNRKDGGRNGGPGRHPYVGLPQNLDLHPNPWLQAVPNLSHGLLGFIGEP